MDGIFIIKTALKANAFFSVISALSVLIFSSKYRAVLELANNNPLLFAITLIIFAAFLLYNAMRSSVSRVMILIIIISDIIYVTGSIIRVTISTSISIAGMSLILICTLIVMVFTIFQTIGLIHHYSPKT
jgi:hypothetical protein